MGTTGSDAGAAFEQAIAHQAEVETGVPKMKLFGSKWDDTPAGEILERVATPVDAKCAKCDQPISATQSGVLMWGIMTIGGEEFRGAYQPWHRICLALEVLGMLPPELDE